MRTLITKIAAQVHETIVSSRNDCAVSLVHQPPVLRVARSLKFPVRCIIAIDCAHEGSRGTASLCLLLGECLQQGVRAKGFAAKVVERFRGTSKDKLPSLLRI